MLINRLPAERATAGSEHAQSGVIAAQPFFDRACVTLSQGDGLPVWFTLDRFAHSGLGNF